ncbi:hypothetical protein RSOLAG22IIIB_01812 [Rhizoctonia solani]|uniref:Uncharacterized protein n=1 Tax=Rhizoctonia solani TaxID=456999 RepID=A0A0K6G9X1_9AGAM|nr:hypothetical protein RSOLAG22IIIB_01812 [Rhizoctonia solani]
MPDCRSLPPTRPVAPTRERTVTSLLLAPHEAPPRPEFVHSVPKNYDRCVEPPSNQHKVLAFIALVVVKIVSTWFRLLERRAKSIISSSFDAVGLFPIGGTSSVPQRQINTANHS